MADDELNKLLKDLNKKLDDSEKRSAELAKSNKELDRRNNELETRLEDIEKMLAPGDEPEPVKPSKATDDMDEKELHEWVRQQKVEKERKKAALKTKYRVKSDAELDKEASDLLHEMLMKEAEEE